MAQGIVAELAQTLWRTPQQYNPSRRALRASLQPGQPLIASDRSQHKRRTASRYRLSPRHWSLSGSGSYRCRSQSCPSDGHQSQVRAGHGQQGSCHQSLSRQSSSARVLIYVAECPAPSRQHARVRQRLREGLCRQLDRQAGSQRGPEDPCQPARRRSRRGA